MTSTTFSNSNVDGVKITRTRVDELLAIMNNAAIQGMPEGVALNTYRLNIKLTRNHNELEFDSLEEMDSVLADFPEWRHPTAMDLAVTAFKHGYSSTLNRKPGDILDFARSMSVRFKSGSPCYVYASGDTTRWGLTTGSLLESQLRKYRGWHRFSRSLLVLTIIAVAAALFPITVNTLWFLPPALFTLSFTLLVMAGMPLGRWFYRNRINLGK